MLKQLFLIGELTGKTEDYTLSIRIGEKHVGFSISEAGTGSLTTLVFYSAELINTESLDHLLSQQPLLKEKFRQVFVGFDYPEATLVPDSLNQPGSAPFILNALYGVNGQSTILQDAVRAWQLQTIYAVPTGVHQWISKHFPGSRYWHQYSIGLKNIKPAEEEGHLLLEMRMEDLSVILSAKGKLLVAQTFSYTNPSDVLYYLLKACEEFHLSPATIKIEISGLIEKDSALFREIWQYFQFPELRNPQWNINDPNLSVAAHFFTSLNDLARCVS
ncbi:MAG TPA: DUF3822 family protein [Chitinophagaceae bacterium]|nr:DUF3822 family protein [Chitinophagaceae bacterium]